jgi:hypothetical protein
MRTLSPRPAALAARAALVLSLAFPAAGAALELTYAVAAGAARSELAETLRPLPGGGYAARAVDSGGAVDELILDAAGSVLEWRRGDPAGGLFLEARRDGRQVRLLGTVGGTAVDKRLDFGTEPWYQLHELSFAVAGFAAGGVRDFRTIDRTKLESVAFRAKPIGPEVLAARTGPVEAVRWELSVRGIPAFLFAARFWLRAGDGRYLRLETPALPGTPAGVVELVAAAD